MFLHDVKDWLTPRSSLDVVAAITAVLAGLFAVVSEGNSTGDRKRAWYQRSRIRAFLFLLSGGGAVLLLDLKSLVGDEHLDKAAIARLFTLWAALVVIFFCWRASCWCWPRPRSTGCGTRLFGGG